MLQLSRPQSPISITRENLVPLLEDTQALNDVVTGRSSSGNPRHAHHGWFVGSRVTFALSKTATTAKLNERGGTDGVTTRGP